MKKNKIVLAAPVLKWVGGKRQLMNDIVKLLPKTYTTYYEPFIGGGAVLFELQPNKAVINDVNGELINLYNVIKYDVELLIEDLRKHENTPEYFYEIRELDRDRNEYGKLSEVEKASRIIYLNKTCFNGLFRVNKAGEFNSPFGKYKNPNIVDEVTLRAVSKYFNKADVKILNGDFESSLKGIRKGSFVYLDPPYDPVSNSANFTGYDKGGFNRDEQIRLKKLCDKLNKRGVKFLLSNSATDFIKDLYKDYDITIVKAKRAINSNGNARGEVDEVLVRNYE
ncbi:MULTISPECIES: DNA adenine methylase [Clostridium]|uniref:DNA adenine methylase n=1 Tax=Clostridium TaxID=1485 RepID=UPI00062E3AD6|nr:MULTISPECIES: DNA adenine methylase [Clostridium]KLE14816.1 modification methylase [Clostridium sp. C8]